MRPCVAIFVYMLSYNWKICNRDERYAMRVYHLGPDKARLPWLVNPAADIPLGRLSPTISASVLVLIYPSISNTPRRAANSSGSRFTRELILSAFGYGIFRTAIAFIISKSVVSVIITLIRSKSKTAIYCWPSSEWLCYAITWLFFPYYAGEIAMYYHSYASYVGFQE